MKTMYAVIAVLAAFALTGLGYFAIRAPQSEQSGSGFRSAAFLPSLSTKTENQQNLEELRTIFVNFQNAKSFRSDIAVDLSGDTTRGEMEIAKPSRFRGKLSVDGETLEVTGVEDILYFKNPDGIWVPLRSEILTEQLQHAFSLAIQGTTEESATLLPDGLTVTKVRDRNRSCDEYSTQIEDESGNTIDLRVCAENGLPLFVEAIRADGSVKNAYRDFNVVIVIERPSIPKAFWDIVR